MGFNSGFKGLNIRVNSVSVINVTILDTVYCGTDRERGRNPAEERLLFLLLIVIYYGCSSSIPGHSMWDLR